MYKTQGEKKARIEMYTTPVAHPGRDVSVVIKLQRNTVRQVVVLPIRAGSLNSLVGSMKGFRSSSSKPIFIHLSFIIFWGIQEKYQ